MQAKLINFETGWFGLELGLTDADISALIRRLEKLRESKGHFHARGIFEGQGGLGDIEFYWTESSDANGLSFE